jgi:hypothetical protein
MGQHGLQNHWGNAAFIFETGIAVILVYIPAVNLGINTRPPASPHFYISGVTYAMCIFFYDEARKFFVRRGITRIQEPGGTLMLYDGWVARNTCY